MQDRQVRRERHAVSRRDQRRETEVKHDLGQFVRVGDFKGFRQIHGENLEDGNRLVEPGLIRN